MKTKRTPPLDRTDFVNRFQKILADVGGLTALSRKSSISITALRNYLADGEPSRPALVALATAAGVRVGWLAKGELPILGGADDPQDFDYTWSGEKANPNMPIPMVNIGDYLKNDAISSGPLIFLPLQWVMGQMPPGSMDPTMVRYWKVHDNSMRPDFSLGDFAFIDTSAKFLLNGLFLFVIDGVFYLNNLWFMGPDSVEASGRDRGNVLFRMTREQFSKEAVIVGRVFAKIGTTL